MFSRPLRDMKPGAERTAASTFSPSDLNKTDTSDIADAETSRQIKIALGLDPDDPNVVVRKLGGLDGGGDTIDRMFASIFGDHTTIEPRVTVDGNAPTTLREILDYERRCQDQALGLGETNVGTGQLMPHEETEDEKVARLLPAIDRVVAEARDALIKAIRKHASMHSPHEGYSVILEEVDELWDEIKLDGGGRDRRARKEAVQVAAMGMRYLLDIDPR